MTILLHRFLTIFSRNSSPRRSIHAKKSFFAFWGLPFCVLTAAAFFIVLGLSIRVVRSLTGTEIKSSSVASRGQFHPPGSPKKNTPAKSLTRLRVSNEALSLQVKANMPKGLYLVIDTAANKVLLRRGEQTITQMVSSCGSGNILENPMGGKDWVFDTPRGQFSIQSKLTKPVWTKPDWAYIEEGEEIPSDPALRSEPGMMGDYALGIGQGYFIHGTLYTRMLGRNVSHGCVRLGDKDLEQLYRVLPLGTQVIIF